MKKLLSFAAALALGATQADAGQIIGGGVWTQSTQVPAANGVHLDYKVQIGTASAINAADSCHAIASWWGRQTIATVSSQLTTTYNEDISSSFGAASSEATKGLNVTNNLRGLAG